jgi:glycerol-3-phosphate acyltransferase PlsY
MDALLLVVFAYLLGSVLFGEVVAKSKGIDLRAVGSGNVGATNVARLWAKSMPCWSFCWTFLRAFSQFFSQGFTLVLIVGLPSLWGSLPSWASIPYLSWL